MTEQRTDPSVRNLILSVFTVYCFNSAEITKPLQAAKSLCEGLSTLRAAVASSLLLFVPVGFNTAPTVVGLFSCVVFPSSNVEDKCIFFVLLITALSRTSSNTGITGGRLPASGDCLWTWTWKAVLIFKSMLKLNLSITTSSSIRRCPPSSPVPRLSHTNYCQLNIFVFFTASQITKKSTSSLKLNN